MYGKYAIFDTIFVGAIWLTFFGMVVFAINPACFDQQIHFFVTERLPNQNEILAKWTAIGVGTTVLGAIIQVISILIFSRHHYDEPARAYLKLHLAQWIADYNAHHPWPPEEMFCPGVLDRVQNAHPDSIFAWIHYSDPRTQLIDWGRRKSRYMYLAENLIVSLLFGSAGGFFYGFWQYVNPMAYPWENLLFLLPVLVLIWFAWQQLWRLREDNRVFVNDMIMIYVAGRIWPGLEERFLPVEVRNGP